MTITQNRNKKERKSTQKHNPLECFVSVSIYLSIEPNTHVFVPEYTEPTFPSSVRLGILVATSSYLVEVARR